MVKLFRCSYFVTLVICSCSVNIRFDPKNTFLKNNNALLRCYATVKSYPFIHDFVFYKNDEILTDKGGVPDFVGTEEHVVYKDLTVDSSGTYVCQVEGKNTTGEVFNEPDKPTPVVADLQGDVHIACPEGPPGAEGILNISNIDRRRVEIKSKRRSVIRNVGYEDVYDTGFCHYNFPSDKIVVTTEIHLIVVRKEVTIPHSDSETSRTVSCSAYSNITDISVTLTPSAKASLNSTYSATRISAELDGNATSINCTVWYNGRAIWTSGIFKEEKGSVSSGISGIPKFIWIILGVLVLGIIFGTVITCCRRHQGNQNAGKQHNERRSGNSKEEKRFIKPNENVKENDNSSQTHVLTGHGDDKKIQIPERDLKRDGGVTCKPIKRLKPPAKICEQ